MDNVLQDMVHRLRAIELLLRTQNELLARMLADLEQITDSTTAATGAMPKIESASSSEPSGRETFGCAGWP